MLQPRPSSALFRVVLLLAVLHHAVLSEDPDERVDDEHLREKRDTANGDVTVLSLEENGRLREPQIGVISSTARTFVNDGATTEFATQIIGTTVGRTYARLLSTGTRVYYDGRRQTKEPVLVFPSLPQPSRTQSATFQTAEPERTNEIVESVGTEKPEQPVVSVRKEFSVKRNTEPIRAAKVRPKSDLPTVTIKNEFAPSGYSAELVEERREEKKSRAGKGLFRAGVPVKNDFHKYDTVTYVGFADFTTTVGDTVIVFMPKTVAQAAGPVTSISGAATLRPEDVSQPVITAVKTFLSHSPGMATKTFTARNEKVHTSLPTVQGDIRASKAYEPVFQSSELPQVTEEPTTNPPTTNSPTTNPTTTNPPITTNQQPTTEQTTEHSTEPTTEEEPEFEPSETVIPSDEVKATETLPVTPTYSTMKSQVFIPGDQPLGLAKSIAVIEAYDETTTYLTSFLFGTIVNGQYTQLTQIASSTSVSEIKPTSVSELEGNDATESGTREPVTTEESEVAESTTENDKNDKLLEKPSINYITRIIPSTIYQTYTYFTTFFIPDGEKSTSVKSREVVTSEVKYITTSIPPPGFRSYSTVSPTEQNVPVTESAESSSTTEEISAEPTPHLPDPALNPTTEESSTEPMSTTEMSTTEKSSDNVNAEEEVEVIIKTLYTTYTYLTTFFQETTTSVKSREVVETNVVTTTIDSEFKATDPAVAGLLNSFSKSPKKSAEKENRNLHIQPKKSENLEIQPTSTEFLKTYTYYTTVFVDGETLIESHTEVITETIQPSAVNTHVQYKTASAEENNIVPRKEANDEQQKRKPSYGTISRPRIVDRPTSEPLIMAPHSAALQSSIDDAYAYDTTMLRDDRIVSTQAANQNIPLEEVLSAREEELKKEAMQAIGMTPVLDDELVETMVTDVTSSSSGGNRRPYDEYESDPNDQISSESNTEEIEPSRTPALVLQTSYTTYTYFTTVYKGPSSHVVSRLETVTNVVTETVRPTEIEAKLSPEEATLPITYFTTFTYWTTLYKGKSTMITSREETVSNVVTPTLPASLSTVAAVEITPAPTEVPMVSEEITPTAQVPIEPTTYYTTYTYFTTSYIGNETVINSHLETETNVVTPTADPETSEVETSAPEEVETATAINPDLAITSTPGSQMTGLISTIRSSEIKDGITTLYNTDVYGTYIDGLYAQVLESSTEIVAPTPASASTQTESQPTGVVSINEGKIVDADGISTTLFTTKAIGTYIDNLYAQVIESTSSLLVDEEKKTATPHLPSTTVIGSKTYTTGLVRLIEGSIIKDGSTTFYESRVIGTLIDGRYAQIIESTSSFKLNMESTEMPTITPTPTPTDVIKPTAHSPSPSSSVIESSQNVDEDENEPDSFKAKQKTKASKASIRPFASRSRPNFLPKRKDPATTITRTSFTPTVTATPASKTKGFGSSRNRFAANRSKSNTLSSAAEIKPTSSSRRFGGSRTRSSSAAGFPGNRARPSSSIVRPTIAASSSRRGGFNYRSTGAVRPSLAASSQRFRIRPTQALGPAKASAVPPSEDINNDINQVSTEEPSEAATAVDEEAATTSAPTTTESPRRANNPLLRFRRPPILQRASTTTTTPKPTSTTKRSSLLRRPDSRGIAATTPRSRAANPSFSRKPRPGNNLFPPRGLLRKPTDEQEEKEEEEEQEQEEEDQPEIDIQDNEYEGSEKSEQHSSTTSEAPKTAGRRGKGISPVSIRPFARRPSRSKRQVEYGTRGYQPKFRRNKSRTTAADVEEEYEQSPTPSWQTTSARYQRNRGRSNYRDDQQPQQQQQQTRERVRPSPVTNTPRHQFTLRERSQTTPMSQRSSYRRTTSSPRRRMEATTSGRIKAPRLRAQTTEASPRTTSRRYSTSRGSTRTTSRARHRDNDFDYSPPPFDGTITVTHRIPTEVTIPVVNGKNTEYKNVITAKPSFEVLGPYQYSTTTKEGKPIIQLTTELTSTLANGLMEVTKYLVYETPTTSVTFTPTTLRGRKTSFSHIVPSTVYEVRPEVSTIQPNLGNAPLANLILSQLLLGNLGGPNTAAPGVPQSPTTEFKTKTTTYVTTVTSHTSTVLPLTFRGKEITTTIVDSSVEVITATEYITETVVITPTAAAPGINNQLNTLLLPALLQAQLLQPQPQLVQNSVPQAFLGRDPLNNNDKLIEDDPEQRFISRDEFEDGERKIREYDQDFLEIEAKPKKKGKIKLKELKQPDKVQSTSVVTLYVSGKHPGEFTTLLSTILVDDVSNVKKREIDYNSYDKNDYFISVSRLPEIGASEDSSQYLYDVAPNNILIESSEIETQSQENESTKYLSFETEGPKAVVETVTGHFLSQGPADSAPEQRAASSGSTGSKRTRREIAEEPRRRRIKVRVPIRRYRNETGYLPSESTQVEDISILPDEVNSGLAVNHRRVKVFKKKKRLDQTSAAPQRKRVLIKKTRLVEGSETTTSPNLNDNYSEEVTTSPKRKKVLVSRKKISPSETTENIHKKRIKITRRRPIPAEVPEEQLDITPTEITIFADSPMATLYNYQYSIPSDGKEKHVMVSEVSMRETEETIPPNDETEGMTEKDDHSETVTENEDNNSEVPEITTSIYEDSNQEEGKSEEKENLFSLTQSQAELNSSSPNPVENYEDYDYDESLTDSENQEQNQPEPMPDLQEPVTDSVTELNVPITEEDSLTTTENTLTYDDADKELEQGFTKDVKLEETSPPSSVTEETERPEEADNTEIQDKGIIPTTTAIEDESTVIQYHYTTRLTTSTRLRTFTYVVTRVSGTEQIVTSSTAVKPDVRTVTVTDLVPIPTAVQGEGRGFLATKRMSNGVEVIVAGRSTAPDHRFLGRPVTLAPSTLTDHMMMLLPQESQKPHNEFATKTYMTTFTYLTTFAQDGSTVVSSREKVISNVVTEEINPSRTKLDDHFTLTASPDLTTGVYHTTYTYLNTLVDGELPLVVTSKKTVSNTVTEQPTLIQPSEVPVQDTNTYLSTVAYTKTLNEGDLLQVMSTEDVLTQVVITESDFIPSALEEMASTSENSPLDIEITPTPITTDIVKTYYATYTYYNTKVKDGETVVETEVITSSDIATETFTIQPKRPKPIESSFEKTIYDPEHNEMKVSETQPLNLYATKTYLTTYTYFTTLLQENKTPSIVVSSSTEVMQNIVTETVDPALFDSGYLKELKASVNENHEPVIATATLSDGAKMEITAMGGDMMKLTDKMDTIEATSPGNVVTGSTIIFFDDDDQRDPQPSSTVVTTHSAEDQEDTTNTPSVTEAGNQSQGQGVTNSIHKNPVKNNLLQFNSLGINGLNALGPVINAMADLFQSKLVSTKKNVTSNPQPVYRPQEQPRPVYIPAFDSEVAESQNIEGPNVYTDAHQRTKQTDRTSIETALLSGGIPISPGQVITTNSDVIIGKHSVHGPRPPLKPFQKEVEGMKPPPPPVPPQSLPNKETWPSRNQERYPSGNAPHRLPSSEKLPPRRDPSHSTLQHLPQNKQPVKNNFIDLRHESSEIKIPGPLKHKPLDSVPQSSKPIDIFQKPHLSNKLPHEGHMNRRPPVKERPHFPVVYPDDTTDLRPPAIQTQAIPSNYIKDNKYPTFLSSKDVFNSQNSATNSIKHVDEIYSAAVAPQTNKVAEPPLGQQLLVNIQPSQVANVIIPHGVSTALIYNKEPEIPSQKGEIFSEPSPYPDAEVGIGGTAGLIRPEDEILHAAVIPSNAVRMDVPVSPQGIGVDPITRLHKDEKKKNFNHLKKPLRNPEFHYLSHGLNYMTPPPPPVSALINYHFSGKEEIPDQEGEYSLKNEYHAEEDDDLSNESNTDYIKNQFLSNKNNKDGPTLADIQMIPPGNSEGMSFSVINSKPVILGNETPESQPPIIKGKPGVSAFVNNSEATVSVGQMTNLKPTDDLDIPSNPLYNVHTTAIIRKPQQTEKKNHSLPRPFDNTVYTMNMDERPPLQAFKAPPHKINLDLPASVDMDLMRLTPRPVYDRNTEGNVVGLTPPALARPHESQTLRTTRRPSPIRKRPVPPYKFEIPNPLDRGKKPTLSDTERPPPPPVPTEELSPPKLTGDPYIPNKNKPQSGEKVNYQEVTTTLPSNINPVLGGSLKVEEYHQKPEVIIADSKISNSNPKAQSSINNVQTEEPQTTKVTPTFAKPNTVLATFANELIVGSESVIYDDSGTTSTEALSVNTRPVFKVTKGSTTKFIPTRQTTTSRYIKPTNTVHSHKTAIPFQINPENDSQPSESTLEKDKIRYQIHNEKDEKEDDNYPNIELSSLPSKPSSHVITHTQTLTVTTTESRIIQSKGQKPSTHTLVVTKTLMSTILDTITEVHTIVKPTSILSTVTTTIPQATTTVYPTVPNPPAGLPTKEPEAFPNDKEKQNHIKNQKTENNNKRNNHNYNSMQNMNDGDTILVVMTDKNTNHKLNSFDGDLGPAPEIEGPEVETNEVAPNVLLSGYLSQYGTPSECNPECKATRNERCQKVNSVMRCVCRPGFARMFLDQPCKPTYTYQLSLPLERNGQEKLLHSAALNDNSSLTYQRFAEMTREGLDRMVMQSELRDVYHGLAVTGFQRDHKDGTPLANFYIQLSENYEEEKLMDVLKKYLIRSNFSVGGTDLHASRAKVEFLKAEDFNECSDERFHDCSENAQCFNLRGSYTCSCKEGFTDLSHNTLYPGRVCSADMIGCELCNYHGNCYQKNEEEEMCECFHWYAGQYCQVNLKVLLLILVLVGVSLGVLLVVCVVLSCMRPRRVPPSFRLRPPPPPDKRAMISLDTASEASLDPPPTFIPQAPLVRDRPKPCRKPSKAPSPPGTLEQRDRSLTVLIPRAKYRPAPGSNLVTMSTFGPEQKLLKYLTPERQQHSGNTSRKPSNSTNHSHESAREREPQLPKKSHSPHLRKPSTGALVSAGFEVSATVGRTKELQECYISEPHTDLGQPGFSTIRTADSSIIVDIPPPPTLEAELLDTSKIDLLTVSEVRSYDETTIHPATKTLRIPYDKNDDSHTMVERDTGSTFIMPQSQLFKPARSNGSDISNFDSL